MNGLQHGRVRLARAHKAWATHYQTEKARIVAALAGGQLRIDHVGSTSVPGLHAKPIVDISLVVSRDNDIFPAVTALTNAGYEYRGDKADAGGHLLIWAQDSIVYSHVHLVAQSDPQWRGYLLFRDKLRKDPALRRRYAELKAALAARFPTDRPAYTDGKATFIRSVLHAS